MSTDVDSTIINEDVESVDSTACTSTLSSGTPSQSQQVIIRRPTWLTPRPFKDSAAEESHHNYMAAATVWAVILVTILVLLIYYFYKISPHVHSKFHDDANY